MFWNHTLLAYQKALYMIRVTVYKADKTVTVRGVFYTSQNSAIWKKDR